MGADSLWSSLPYLSAKLFNLIANQPIYQMLDFEDCARTLLPYGSGDRSEFPPDGVVSLGLGL